MPLSQAVGAVDVRCLKQSNLLVGLGHFGAKGLGVLGASCTM